MRVVDLIRVLVLPACLSAAYAQEAYGDAHDLDDAIYESGLYTADQGILGNLPCPDYTKYATQRQ